MDALELKIDGMTALIKQLGKDIQTATAAIEANNETLKIAGNSIESMAEAFRQLTERITAEPDEANAVHELLEHIERTGTANYKMLTEVVGKIGRPNARNP